MATWVIGDVHGYYDEFMAIMQNPEIEPDDKFILIGDIIDRGPDSLKMIEWAMENVNNEDPESKYRMVIGNHELNIVQDYDRLVRQRDERLKCSNGMPPEPVEEMDIYNLDCHYRFDEYMCRHGYETINSVKHIIEWFRKLPAFIYIEVNERKYVIAHGWYGSGWPVERIVWERDIQDIGPGFKEDYTPLAGEILVHGHTPTLEDNGYPENAVVYHREHSINIDCGVAYPEYGGRLAMIRLEDLKTVYQDSKIYYGESV